MQLNGGLAPQTLLCAEPSGEFFEIDRQYTEQTRTARVLFPPSNHLTLIVIMKDLTWRRQFDLVTGEILHI